MRETCGRVRGILHFGAGRAFSHIVCCCCCVCVLVWVSAYSPAPLWRFVRMSKASPICSGTDGLLVHLTSMFGIVHRTQDGNDAIFNHSPSTFVHIIPTYPLIRPSFDIFLSIPFQCASITESVKVSSSNVCDTRPLIDIYIYICARVRHAHQILVRWQYKNHFPVGIRWFAGGTHNSARQAPAGVRRCRASVDSRQQTIALKSLTQRFKKRISLANPQNQRLPGEPHSRVHTLPGWRGGCPAINVRSPHAR